MRSLSARTCISLALTLLLAGPAAAQTAQERLWDAAIAGDTTALLTAIADGASLDSLDTRTNPNGRLALNWAAWYDRVPAIRVLLEHGARIDATNRTGFTALHHAAEAGSLSAAEALLEAGADPTLPNRGGRRPAETARGNGHDAVAMVLTAAEKAVAKEE